jgi:hypothetical protein
LSEGLKDFSLLEAELLRALKEDGARLLEAVLNDPALPFTGSQPQAGEENQGRRPKTVLCLLGWIFLQRTYLYDPREHQGRFPLDEALGLIDGYSPGVARWMCRSGTLAGSYGAASQDLLTYGGLQIDARQIQRMIIQMAPRLERWRQAQEPIFDPAAGDIFCVGTDGTGAPMRAKYLRGRKGKGGGKARTREVKVGTVFTHRQPALGQRPERDYQSTSYIADIISAKDFGTLLRAEARRRGIARAKKVVFLGDGAPWVWELARVNFSEAVCILDYYHACEHLSLLAELLYGDDSPLAKRQARRWRKNLLKDKLAQIITEAKADLPKRTEARKLANKQIRYFERNHSRMTYQTFRQAGYFIGSGVVEAGCKTVVGQRFKQSGMLWSRPGARHLLTVRCALLSGWFDQFWKARNGRSQTQSFAE